MKCGKRIKQLNISSDMGDIDTAVKIVEQSFMAGNKKYVPSIKGKLELVCESTAAE